MAETLVRLRGLELNLHPPPRPFDFRAMAGETWMLVGAVGSGRRELIRTIAGLAVPRTGHIELFGQVVERMNPRARARLRGRIEKVLNAAKAKGYRAGENPDPPVLGCGDGGAGRGSCGRGNRR